MKNNDKGSLFLYWLLLISCFFPFLNLLRLPTDSQPNSLLLSVIIILFNYKQIKERFPVKLVLFIFIALIAFSLLCISELNIDSIFSFTSYISLLIVPLAVYISLNKIGGVPKKLFFLTIILWGVVALIQRFIYVDFLSFLLYRNSGAGLMGRGVNSLAPEPTYYASILALFLIIFLINYTKKNNIYIFIILFQLILLSLSSTIIAVLFSSLLLYLFLQLLQLKLNKYIILSFISFVFIIPFILVYFNESLEETRIYSIANILINNPDIILLDESINERVNHAIFPLISIYDHYGLPMGFNRFQDYIISKMKNNSFSIFFVNIELDHYRKIMSAYGAVFFELGILGFTIPYYLYSIFRTVLKNKVYLFSFILLNLLLFTSISLNNSLILFVFGNVLYLKKQNFKTID